ncbi:MAG: aldehyde ferredoxin oxidoreductase family protein [Chloroflexi bacterium]|nr:aldehyde ferredoxin oxidoreductase family protein [Chloroflexota bacterium]
MNPTNPAASPPKLLRIDLNTGRYQEEAIPGTTVRDYIGGRGFGVKYLYRDLKPGVEPFSPDNKLILHVGPLAGTGALCVSRWIATGKSPLTGTYFRSVGGDDFGAWLRWTGYEMVVLEGRAAVPSYILFREGKPEIRDARDIRSKTTSETQRLLREKHGDNVRTACIGPAGENLVRFAGIFAGTHCAGRGGMGAVMGAKNIKAIAIDAVRNVELPDPPGFKALLKEEAAAITKSRGFPVFAEHGTTHNQDNTTRNGIFPTKNFRYGTLDGWERFSGGEFDKMKVANVSCYACPMHCGNKYRVPDGPYAGATAEGPDYETIWAFTGAIDSNEIGATILGNHLCDELGLDTMSMGSAAGFACELYEREILTPKDTGGLDLKWGDHRMLMDLIRKTAYRDGIGDLLAEGTRLAAQRLGKGADYYAMHIKGLEIPAYDPRGVKGQGLSYATSSIGASHNIGYSVQELFGSKYPRPVDRRADSGHADVVMYNQDSSAAFETGVLCLFTAQLGMIRLPFFGKMMASVRSAPEFSDPEYLMKVGQRIYNLERAFNLREGIGRKEDSFPLRLTSEPLLKAGPSEGLVLGNPDLMIDEYYKVRGWDQNGVPTAEKLRELGLEETL